MSFNYEELLDRACSKLPRTIEKHERFEIPRVRSSIIGMRTVFYNFREISEMLNRDPAHLMKFLTREMATAATLKETHAIFQGKFSTETLERLISRYVERYVVCPVCKRPDTKIVKEKRLSFLLCEACGAKSSIRSM
jgi:translation initiation factor 2 subunit 2